ncbi:hypothetical protein CYMTET_38278, partial [Cymbomonas tetramitiformis]
EQSNMSMLGVPRPAAEWNTGFGLTARMETLRQRAVADQAEDAAIFSELDADIHVFEGRLKEVEQLQAEPTLTPQKPMPRGSHPIVSVRTGPRLSRWIAFEGPVAPPWSAQSRVRAHRAAAPSKGSLGAECAKRVAERLGRKARGQVAMAGAHLAFNWRHVVLVGSKLTRKPMVTERKRQRKVSKVVENFLRTRWRRLVIRLVAYARMVWLWRRLQEDRRAESLSQRLGLPIMQLRNYLPFAGCPGEARGNAGPKESATLVPARGALAMVPVDEASQQDRAEWQEREEAGTQAGDAGELLGEDFGWPANSVECLVGTAAVLAFLHHHQLVERAFLQRLVELAARRAWGAPSGRSFRCYGALMAGLLAWPGGCTHEAFATLWNLRCLQSSDGGYGPSPSLGRTVYGKFAAKEEEMLRSSSTNMFGSLTGFVGKLSIVEERAHLGAIQRVWASLCVRAMWQQRMPCGCLLSSPHRSTYQSHRRRVLGPLNRYLKAVPQPNQLQDQLRALWASSPGETRSRVPEGDHVGMLKSFTFTMLDFVARQCIRYLAKLREHHAAKVAIRARQRSRIRGFFRMPSPRQTRGPSGPRGSGGRGYLRLLLQSEAERHPWMGLWRAAWPRGEGYPAHQRACALVTSWLVMLAGAVLLQYDRAARLCPHVRPAPNSFLDCAVPGVPFQGCDTGSSCKALYSEHLCAAHGTCADSFAASAQLEHEWRRAALEALLLTLLPVLVRDFPASFGVHPAPQGGRYSTVTRSGLTRIAVALEAVMQHGVHWGLAVPTRWRFWWQTSVQRRSPWAAFQELEMEEGMRTLRRSAGRTLCAEMSVCRAAEFPGLWDVGFYIWNGTLSAAAVWVVVQYGLWIQYLSGESGEQWTYVIWAISILMDGIVSAVVTDILKCLRHFVLCAEFTGEVFMKFENVTNSHKATSAKLTSSDPQTFSKAVLKKLRARKEPTTTDSGLAELSSSTDMEPRLEPPHSQSSLAIPKEEIGIDG